MLTIELLLEGRLDLRIPLSCGNCDTPAIACISSCDVYSSRRHVTFAAPVSVYTYCVCLQLTILDALRYSGCMFAMSVAYGASEYEVTCP